MGNDAHPLPESGLWRVHLLILVVLGTHERPFTRLLQDVETLADKGVIDETLYVQNGHTPVERFTHLHGRPFLDYAEMDTLYDQARVIISHGGTGSIITGVKKRKPVIARARLSRYGEHNDDHQEEIIEQFVKTGHVLSSDDLAADLKRVDEGFTPAPFDSGRHEILKLLRNFLAAT